MLSVLLAVAALAPPQQTVTIPTQQGPIVSRTVGDAPGVAFDAGMLARWTSCGIDHAVISKPTDTMPFETVVAYHVEAVRSIQADLPADCSWVYGRLAPTYAGAEEELPIGTMPNLGGPGGGMGGVPNDPHPEMYAQWKSGGITYGVVTKKRGLESVTAQAKRHTTAVQALARLAPPDAPTTGG